MRRKTSLYVLVTLVLALQCIGCAANGNTAPDAKSGAAAMSPVIDQEGADPFVLRTQDGYLYMKTTGTDIRMARVSGLPGFGAAQSQCIYVPESGGLRDLWAPEIWHLDDCWYVYFAACPPGDTIHHMYVLHNPSEDPMTGSWTCEPLRGIDEKFAIDGTIYERGDGSRYFLWSGWEGDENVRQDIYIAQMLSPTEIAPEKILLSSPEYDWECVGDPLVNEGPEILVRGETVNLVYSASGSWTDSYCLGLLTMKDGEDPLAPENWHKADAPILERAGDVYGPGHNCFTLSRDGSQDLIIYHAARWEGAGWDRNIRFGYVDCDEKGAIRRIEPVSGEDMLDAPAGEELLASVLPDAFVLEGGAERAQDGTEVHAFLRSNDAVTVPVRISDAGPCTVVVTVRTYDEFYSAPATDLTMACVGITHTSPVYGAVNPQPVVFSADLPAEKSELRLYSDAGLAYMEILRVDVFR